MERKPFFKDRTKCDVCSKHSIDQICFQCGHRYCKSCSPELFESSTLPDTQKCPTCQKPTHISNDVIGPRDGLLTCQMSIRVSTDDIIGPKEVFLSENDSCSVCSLTGNEIPASYKCLDCLDRLCDNCSKGHLASSSTVSHRIVPFVIPSPELDSPEIPASRKLKCDKHPEEEISFYCKSCNQSLCKLCTLFDHMNHERYTIQQATEVAKEKIHSIIKERTIRLSELECQRDKALAALNTLKESETNILDNLNSECESIIRPILAERSAITQTVNSMFGNQKNELLLASDVIERCLKLARDTLITCTNALSGDKMDLLMLCNKLNNELNGIHETENSLFQMCTPHEVPLLKLHTQIPNWPIFTIQVIDPISKNTSVCVSEVVQSENHVPCNSDNISSTSTKDKHTDVSDMRTPEKRMSFKDTQATICTMRNDITEMNTKAGNAELSLFYPGKKLNMEDICDDHTKTGNNAVSLSTKAKHTKFELLHSKKTGNNAMTPVTKTKPTQLKYLHSKETNPLEDGTTDQSKTENNTIGSITSTNTTEQKSLHCEETKDCEEDSDGHRKKQIYVPKGFYKYNKQSELNENVQKHDGFLKSKIVGKVLHGSLLSLHVSEDNSSQTTTHTMDAVRPGLKWADICKKRPVSTKKKTAVEKYSFEAETVLPLQTRGGKRNFTNPVFMSNEPTLPSTYSDAVKMHKTPESVKQPQLTLSLHHTFDTAVKKDNNETEIKGLCFYEDDRILVSDRGNRKLKNLLKDGKQPHNRQFDTDVEPDRIASVEKNIACISKNFLYILTKNVEVINKLSLSDTLPKEDAIFSFCLTAIKDHFIVGNLPENKLKIYRSTTGKTSSEFICPVKYPIASMSSNSKGQLLICSWRGHGSVHLVDLSGKELQQFIRPGLHKAKNRWQPNDACFDLSGFVFAADYSRSEINVFNPQGDMILAYNTEIDGLARPHCLIVDTDNKVYVSGDGSHIMVYNIKY